MDIAIVTDSTADIPKELVEKHQIHVVPNLVVIGGKSLKDGIDLSREAFYNDLPSMRDFPTTSTASSGTFQEIYEGLLKKGYKKILSIHASSLLSGIFNSARTAALNFEEKVMVVDSKLVSLGLGFQVLTAAEAVKKIGAVSEILALLDNLRQRIKVVAMLDTLEYVRRGGRVSWAKARLGNILQVKPLVEIKEGIVHSLGEVRTRSKGIARLHQLIQGLGKLERLAVLHTNAKEDAVRFLADLKPELQEPALIVNVTTVIGAHVGPNGLGFAAVSQAQ